MMWGSGFGFGMGWTGMLVQFLLIGGVLYFVGGLFKREPSVGSAKSNADTILQERFAQGEISEQEYKRLREVLSK